MHKFLIFCFALCFFTSLATAVKVRKHTSINKVEKLQIDSSKIILHKFNADALDQYRNSPDFTYAENAKAGISWWQQFWVWFWKMIARLFGGRPDHLSAPSFPYMQYLIALALLALLIFVIFKLAGLNLANIFNRQSREFAIPYSESLENIHQITFDEEIEKALSQRNYRLAVRLLYLRTLKQLNDAGLINWKIEKTNAAYLNELTDIGQRQSFGILTRQFEYVWYGDFPVDDRSFQNIHTLFHDFKIS